MNQQSIERKKIEIAGLEDMQSVAVEADPDMIHQVLYNLIDNAVKFTQEGGQITASVLSDSEKVIVRIRIRIIVCRPGGGVAFAARGRVAWRRQGTDRLGRPAGFGLRGVFAFDSAR